MPLCVLMSVFIKKMPVKWTLFYFKIDLRNHLVKDRRLLIQLAPSLPFWWLVELPMWLTDGFSVTFFGRWRGAVRIHMSHVQLTCTVINMHVTTIWWRGALMCGSPVAINMHITTIWWRGALTCGSRVAINMHFTTIWWRGALMCGSRLLRVAINVHVTTI